MKRLESTIIIIIISHDSSHAVIIINIQTFSLYGLTFFRYFLSREKQRERDSTKRSLYLNDKCDNLSFASILNEEKKKSNPTTRRRSIRSERQEDYSRIKAAGDIYVTTSTFMSFVTIRKSKSKRSPTGFMLREICWFSPRILPRDGKE